MNNDHLSKLERETIITFNQKEGSACVWSTCELVEKKMESLGLKGVRSGPGLSWVIPKGLIKIGKA